MDPPFHIPLLRDGDGSASDPGQPVRAVPQHLPLAGGDVDAGGACGDVS